MTATTSLFHSDSPLPKPLSSGHVWHYTTPAGFLGIVQGGVLRASNARVMNDTGELAYGLSLLQQEWAEFDRTDANPIALEMIDAALDVSAKPETASRIYFACGSTTGDMLVQWLAYANPAGYAIQMKVKMATEDDSVVTDWQIAGDNIVFPTDYGKLLSRGWHPVIYNESEQRRLARELYSWVLSCDTDEVRHPSSWDEETMDFETWPLACDLVAAQVQTLMTLFKHPAFEDEREVRFIADTIGIAPIKFLPKSNKIVPYVEVGVPVYEQIGDALPREFTIPIVDVVCGPNCEQAAPSIAGDVLRRAGHGTVKPRPSGVPRLDV